MRVVPALSRGRKLLVLGAIAAMASVGVAFAWFGSQGSGTALVTIGHSPVGVRVTAAVDSTGGPIYPGQSRPVTVHIANTGGHGSVHVGSITGSVSGLPVGCQASWFTFSVDPISTTLAQGASTDATNGSLWFAESGTDQTACADATPTLTVNVS